MKWEYNQEKEKEKEVTTGTTTEMKIYDIQVQKSSEALINVAKSEEHNEDVRIYKNKRLIMFGIGILNFTGTKGS